MYYVSSFLHLIRIWGILYYMVVTQSIPLVWRPGFLFLIVMLTINCFHVFLHFLQKFVYSWSIQILFSAKKKLSGLFWVKYLCRLVLHQCGRKRMGKPFMARNWAKSILAPHEIECNMSEIFIHDFMYLPKKTTSRFWPNPQIPLLWAWAQKFYPLQFIADHGNNQTWK